MGEKYYRSKAEFDYKEATSLWCKGWSYAELGEKYSYHKNTIKKYVKEELQDDFEEALKKHQRNRGVTNHRKQLKEEGQIDFLET